MTWNPNIYNQFKAERFAPFDDVLALTAKKPNLNVIDLGCGTGELTSKLASALPNSTVLGIDSSLEMLADAKAFSEPSLSFKESTIEQVIASNKKYDLVFSNAAIQWVDNHIKLFPQLIKLLNPGGQLAIQMPSQTENTLNKLMDQLVKEHPYKETLKDYHLVSPVLKTDAYAQILFENGAKQMDIFEKIYPIIVPTSNELYDFISGSALTPYLERMDGAIKENFITEFKNRIKSRFPNSPALYPFKRIIITAKF